MELGRLSRFLDENGVKYVTMRHSPAYTAQETAASAHVRGRNLAKTVIVKISGRLSMVVLRADHRVNLERLKEATGTTEVEIAEESEFESLFPDCDTGAMPPFGNLWDMPVYVDHALTADEEIVFNAGSHAELVQLSYEDYARLVHPQDRRFAEQLH
jgi:Ala-tRNA(Pro) deacylase